MLCKNVQAGRCEFFRVSLAFSHGCVELTPCVSADATDPFEMTFPQHKLEILQSSSWAASKERQTVAEPRSDVGAGAGAAGAAGAAGVAAADFGSAGGSTEPLKLV